jgi:LPXTG-motif cell wall-anchored protein
MKQLRVIAVALIAGLLLFGFVTPANADDSTGDPAAASESTTTTTAAVPETTPAPEVTEPEATETTEPEAVAEEPAAEAPAEEPAAEDADTATASVKSTGQTRRRPAANPGTGTTPGGQQVTIIIDSPASGEHFNPGDSVVVRGRVAIGTLGASVDIVYTLDSSGSTSGDAGDCTGDGVSDTILACEQAGAIAINNQFVGLAGVQVGVVDFNSGATVAQPFTNPADPAVANAINGLVSGGGTNFDAALQSTVDLFNTSASGNRRINYFMSDGFGSLTEGPGTPLQAAIDAGIQVNTFSLGIGAANCTDSTSPLLIIAQSTGGVCTEVTDVSQILAVVDTLRPAGIDRVEVSINGGPPVVATLDLLGNFEATVGSVVLGENTIVATVYTDDGGAVGTSADVVVLAGEETASGGEVGGTSGRAGTLPVTGSDSLPIALTGAALLLLGAALVVVTRKAQRA